jgi:hypothetical protein
MAILRQFSQIILAAMEHDSDEMREVCFQFFIFFL